MDNTNFDNSNKTDNKMVPIISQSGVQEQHDKEYKGFDKWRKERSITILNEDVLLDYFQQLSSKYKATTLWVKYYSLKNTLYTNEKFDITNFDKLTDFIKAQGVDYEPKRTKILERKHIDQFLLEAPDCDYLMMKVALLFGIFGACRTEELTYLTVDEIKDKGTHLQISLLDTKTNHPRTFLVTGDDLFLKLYRKYVALRPSDVEHNRFFLHYKDEKCTVRPVGIRALQQIPCQIATYLKLPDTESYTGYSFRRSAKLLINNIDHRDGTVLKRPIKWSSCGTKLIKDVVPNKIQKIAGEVSSTNSGGINNLVVNGKNCGTPKAASVSFQIKSGDKFKKKILYSPGKLLLKSTKQIPIPKVLIPQIPKRRWDTVDTQPISVQPSNEIKIKVEDCEQTIQNSCYICMKPNGLLLNLKQVNADNVEILTKLQACIPEICWEIDHMICLECSSQLDSAYNFRQMCLNSHMSRQQQQKQEQQQNEENIIVDNIKTEIDIEQPVLVERSVKQEDFICSCCDRSFCLQSNLIQHILVAHNTDPLGDEGVMENVKRIENKHEKNDLEFALLVVKCYICDMYFNNHLLLDQHIDNVHPAETKLSFNLFNHKRKFICTVCGKEFLTLSNFDKHKEKHMTLNKLNTKPIKINNDPVQRKIKLFPWDRAQ